MNNFLNNKTISISLLDIFDVEFFLNKLSKFVEENNINNVVIHFDIMDEDFVTNKGIDLNLISLVKKYNFFVDVHLMCLNPREYIEKAIYLGADNITIHYEIDNLYENLVYLNQIKKSLEKEKRKLLIGLAIKPETDIYKVFEYISLFDIILLMSVKPGLGGQVYIADINKKIQIATSIEKTVQIDGGINKETIILPNELGVQSFVVGSYITKDKDCMFEKIKELSEIINSEKNKKISCK